ncbi:MAG TPA: hypothetical protein VG797_00620, partial [Phycisphaerales bacterium]|nr:hypothetical protein [Phycisphaerales bacterium]
MTSIFPIALGGCASGPTNPSFDVSIDEAESAIREMEASPRPFDRPVVVVCGHNPRLKSRIE